MKFIRMGETVTGMATGCLRMVKMDIEAIVPLNIKIFALNN